MQSNSAIKSAFVISFFGHFLCLGMPGINMNLSQSDELEDIIVSIEVEKPFLLPKIDFMGEKKEFKEIVEKPKEPEPKLEPQPEEAAIIEPSKEVIEEKAEIIGFDSEAMLRYQDMVKQRIEEARRYPYWAKRQRLEGVAHLSFAVLSDGTSRDVRITRSSGLEFLDKEAIKTIKRANPFPPIPQEMNHDFVSMEVSIVYTLQ